MIRTGLKGDIATLREIMWILIGIKNIFIPIEGRPEIVIQELDDQFQVEIRCGSVLFSCTAPRDCEDVLGFAIQTLARQCREMLDVPGVMIHEVMDK